MFLTDDEIIELTGYIKPACQIRWLQRNQWPMAVDGQKRPKVLRSVVLARLGDSGKVSTEPRLRLA
jgi:hypothetical protein